MMDVVEKKSARWPSTRMKHKNKAALLSVAGEWKEKKGSQ